MVGKSQERNSKVIDDHGDAKCKCLRCKDKRSIFPLTYKVKVHGSYKRMDQRFAVLLSFLRHLSLFPAALEYQPTEQIWYLCIWNHGYTWHELWQVLVQHWLSIIIMNLQTCKYLQDKAYKIFFDCTRSSPNWTYSIFQIVLNVLGSTSIYMSCYINSREGSNLHDLLKTACILLLCICSTVLWASWGEKIEKFCTVLMGLEAMDGWGL